MSSPTIFQGQFTRLLTAGGIIKKDGSLLNYSGSANFLLNGHFEQGTSGWATYADAAGASPVDGTGGTGLITISRTEASTFAGYGYGVITKDAVNRQGHGVSYDFSISSSYKSKLMKIEFEFLTSVNYVAGDLKVYLYDVTGGALVTLSTNNIPASTTVVKFSATYTATTSTSYRLIIHCGSVSALAYTVSLDDLKVSPVDYLMGASGGVGSTDNAVARWDGATGLLLQNSTVVVDDNGLTSIGGTAFAATAQLHVKSYNAAVVSMILDTQVGHAADLAQYKINGVTKGVWNSEGKFVAGGATSLASASASFISASAVDQPISIQNTAVTGYSQFYIYDSSANIVGAFGYANASAAVSASKLFMSTVAKDFYISTDASTTRHLLLSATSGRALFTNTVIAGTVGVSAQITGSGSAGGVLAAGKFSLLAGYTGTSGSFGVYAQNQTAGTATDEFSNAQAANYGEYIATTTGTVIGQAGYASGGNKSYGGFFRAIIDKAASINVGVGGFASNTGTAQVGGFFGLMSTAPTYTSSALICDNGATTSPIFLARDNGTTVFSIVDGGVATFSKMVQNAKGANIASAGDLTLGSDGNFFVITGNTTINAITTTGIQAGTVVAFKFVSTPTVKHNTAGGAGTAVIYLNGGVDFVAAGQNTLTLIYDGSQWTELARKV